MTSTNHVARAERHYAFPPEEVFDAWLDPESLAQWMLVPSWERGVSAEADPKVGGGYRLVMHKPEGDVVHTGTYLEIDRPNRLVFTWTRHGSTVVDSVVTVALHPRDGGTDLSVIHDNLPSAPTADAHVGGWVGFLNNLDGFLNRRLESKGRST
ncbi:MAG: SRPBCC domain-containing protein [Proteobacteria bacterium]|nr:SRPBCC domain-containing protein [Pseudomonadota bacterium]MDA1058392.1 SRPBCC domain-containing protein [Pseudomonadota bacterium]